MSARVDGESPLYRKTLGCLLGGLIGDAMGTPSEGREHPDLERELGWIDDFETDGTDDTVMKTLLCRALIRTGGYATSDDWAQEWLSDWQAIFGEKRGKFFVSVLHTAQKLRDHAVPRMAALGNMPSSSSAMSISPVGIVNACNPAQAASQAYRIAGLIHVHDVGFCQDAAAAVAAAVAAAFEPEASVASVLEAAKNHIMRPSGTEMLDAVEAMLELASEQGEYRRFRSAVYEARESFLRRIVCDSRETVPLALSLFLLAGGDFEKTVVYAANFGRDADTIATMGGAIAGALAGSDGIRSDWVAKAKRITAVDQEELAGELVGVALQKAARERAAAERLEGLAAG